MTGDPDEVYGIITRSQSKELVHFFIPASRRFSWLEVIGFSRARMENIGRDQRKSTMKEITTKKRDTIESKLPSSRSNKTKILKKKKETVVERSVVEA